MWVNWRPQCHCKQISHSTVLLLYTSFGTAIFICSMHKYFFCTFIYHDTYTCDLFAVLKLCLSGGLRSLVL